MKPHLRYRGLMFTKKSSIQLILCTFSCHPSQLRIDHYCSFRFLFVHGIPAPQGFQLTVKFESISFLALLIVIQVPYCTRQPYHISSLDITGDKGQEFGSHFAKESQ